MKSYKEYGVRPGSQMGMMLSGWLGSLSYYPANDGTFGWLGGL